MEQVGARVPADGVFLDGDLSIPSDARGLVLFAHGSGSSRHSPRNRFVAGVLNGGGLATLLTDLLTEDEERIDLVTAELRFDIDLLADRLVAIADWLAKETRTKALRLGLFGSSTGAAAALIAAARRPNVIGAVVSRGGRPDLAKAALPRVLAPTLLIVGGDDEPVIRLNEQAFRVLNSIKLIEIIPGATHLFEEPGALEEVARHARAWFERHLGPRETRRPRDEPAVSGP